mgnify:CR=1 FL=1
METAEGRLFLRTCNRIAFSPEWLEYFRYPMEQNDGLLDMAMFEAIVLRASVKNKTTMKDILPTATCSIVVEEILENGIVLTTPGASFARDHKISVWLEPSRSPGREPQKFVGSGKVVGLETFADGTEKVTVEWTQFDQESWDKMWSVFDERQKQIELFLAQVKG